MLPFVQLHELQETVSAHQVFNLLNMHIWRLCLKLSRSLLWPSTIVLILIYLSALLCDRVQSLELKDLLLMQFHSNLYLVSSPNFWSEFRSSCGWKNPAHWRSVWALSWGNWTWSNTKVLSAFPGPIGSTISVAPAQLVKHSCETWKMWKTLWSHQATPGWEGRRSQGSQLLGSCCNH